jgi:hypothetical protein
VAGGAAEAMRGRGWQAMSCWSRVQRRSGTEPFGDSEGRRVNCLRSGGAASVAQVTRRRCRLFGGGLWIYFRSPIARGGPRGGLRRWGGGRMPQNHAAAENASQSSVAASRGGIVMSRGE